MKDFGRAALYLALTVGIASPSLAQVQAERYERLQAEAAQGDVDAAYDLGVMYYLGNSASRGGPERDTERAVEIFQPLAENGHARAQWRLGWAYEMGSGVERDAEMAYRLYSASAEQGFVHAKQTLGKLYLDGRGAPQDADQAYHLLRDAAEADVTRAMVDLARLYRDPDLGPVHDSERAVHWFRTAAEKNEPNAVRGLSEAYMNGDGVPRDPVEAVRVYVEYEARSGREQTNTIVRILGQMSEEDRAQVIAVGDAEDWLATE